MMWRIGRADAGAAERGSATVEYALAYTALILPLTFALIFTAELLWVWHSVNDFTRQGARYAATHCWQGGADNIISYMRTHVPPMADQDQFQSGPAEIEVSYFARDPESGGLVDFECDGSDCSTECVPDVVTVRVVSYEFRGFMAYLGLPPVPIPSFQTSMPIESAGCDPDQDSCLP